MGHAYSALLACDTARASKGAFHLRIDDIDQSRARPHWETQIYEDLHWLGIEWPEPVWRQSERTECYRNALGLLWQMGLLYPCNCSRKDIQAAANAPQEGSPLQGPDGIVYPGTCRNKPRPAQMPEQTALRLDLSKASHITDMFEFKDTGVTPGTYQFSANEMLNLVGDPVLVRRDMAASYHLSIVVDDADQGITHVIRGQDLFDATRIHVVLQKLLGLSTPVYQHHKLIRDHAGKRLAKRDDARAIATYRANGLSPNDIRNMVEL